MKKCSFNKSLYSKAALLKAAYHFTDRFYVYLDMDDANYLVELIAKDGIDDRYVQEEFSNEILAQSTREEILRQTANIRELILGRAFGSTIMDAAPEETTDTPPAEQTDKIFRDWYEA
ncbi:MAG: His-Xaa-Ser system protein HxsD [Oscillibacter sp.]|nr:His-Xaa-Ser system protein HxsD [Oscillibacter sp.]